MKLNYTLCKTLPAFTWTVRSGWTILRHTESVSQTISSQTHMRVSWQWISDPIKRLQCKALPEWFENPLEDRQWERGSGFQSLECSKMTRNFLEENQESASSWKAGERRLRWSEKSLLGNFEFVNFNDCAVKGFVLSPIKNVNIAYSVWVAEKAMGEGDFHLKPLSRTFWRYSCLHISKDLFHVQIFTFLFSKFSWRLGVAGQSSEQFEFSSDL